MKKIRTLTNEYWSVLLRSNEFIFGIIPRQAIFVMMLLLLIAEQSWLVDSLLYGKMLDAAIGNKVINGVSITTQILLLTGAYLTFSIISSVINYFGEKKKQLISYTFKNKLNYLFNKKISELSLKDLDDPKIKDSMRNARENLGSTLSVFESQFDFIENVFTVFVAILAISYFKWWFGAVILTTVIPLAYINSKRNFRKYRYDKRSWPHERYLEELRNHIGSPESRVHGSESWFVDRFDSMKRKFSMASFIYENNKNKVGMWVKIINMSVVILLIFYLFNKVANGEISAGSVIVIISSFTRIKGSFSYLINMVSNSSVELSRANDFFYFMDKEPSIVTPFIPIKIGNEYLPEINFENVSFRYEDNLPMTLENISVSINPGDHIGIVGHNAAGKSTFIKLLLGLYDPTFGRVMVNGVDMRNIDRSEYQRMIGVLFQENQLFKTTIASAIHTADINSMFSRTRVVEALEKVGFNMEENMKYGIDTWISRNYNNGIKLSGGQLQKLGLAKLFYRDPKVVILDEPTASLDPIAEAEIFENYSKAVKGKTAIMISHRFSSLCFANRIVVLDSGRIIGDGSHEALMTKCPLYAEMYSRQLAQISR